MSKDDLTAVPSQQSAPTTARGTYTSEPWDVQIFDGDTFICKTGDGNPSICEMQTGCADFEDNADINEETMSANARRIVGCVNACTGIPLEALEAGTLAFVQTIRALAKMEAQRDEIEQQRDSLANVLQRHHAYQKELQAAGYGDYLITTLCQDTEDALTLLAARTLGASEAAVK